MNALVLPIVLPLLTATVLLLAPHRPLLQRGISFAGAIALAVAAITLFVRVEHQGIQVLQSGGWPAPFGITLVADLLAAMLLVATGAVGVAVTASAFAGVDPRREAFGYHGLCHVLLMGVSGAFLTGDLFNLYVWFEVMLVASFVLMALYRTRAQIAAAFKYVTLNLIASSMFLTALGLLYGGTGTLNMADLAAMWPASKSPALESVLAILFLIAFGVKAALFPLFFWLPASYHTPPAAVGAIFAGLLTKVGVYALIRVFTLVFREAPAGLYTLLLAQAICTMLVGLIGALTQRDFRRILSFNLVGHLGYTTVGLALTTPAAMAASILYMLHHIFVITNLYLVSGIFLRLRRTTDLAALGSMYRDRPLVAVLAMIPVFSLAGVPPLSGFIGKLALLRATFDAGAYWTGAVILIVGVLTLLSMARLWDESFWKSAPHQDRAHLHRPVLIPIAFLSAVTIVMTFAAEPLFWLTWRASEQLLRPELYIDAVLKRRTVAMILGNLLLALAWVALSGQFTLESLLTGTVLGHLVLLVLARGGVLPVREVGRVERVLALLAYLLWQIVLANFRIALDVVSIRHRMRPGVIRLPLDVTTEGEILLLAAMINITPGSVALGVSDDRRVMYVHVMHMQSPDEARRDIKTGFERRILQLRGEAEEKPRAI